MIDIFDTLSANQPHKMIKRTQTIRRVLPKNSLSVFGHFVQFAPKKSILKMMILS